MSASEYMNKVRALADTMAAAGSPLRDDEVIDYMLTGLGSAYNPIAASLSVVAASVSVPAFYSMVLNYEALQLSQQAETEEWSSSANVASRPVYTNNPGRMQDYGHPSGGPSGGRPAGGNSPHGQGQGGNGRNGGGGGNGRKWRPKCQLCKNWGHEATACRKFLDRDDRNTNPSGNMASTSSNDQPHWHMDTGATDHLTSDLERLHVYERYGGKDHVQVANGAGLSISHIGHSQLAGSSLRLNNVLHVPRISKHLLSVYRLVSDNDVFVEFHRDFFLVKDKATRRTLLQGSSHGGLYPIPFHRASSSSPRHASSSITTSSRWHQRLGHPANNVVQSIVKQNNLKCSSDNQPLVCDACQCAKSRHYRIMLLIVFLL